MPEEKVERTFRQYQQALWLVYGISLTLLISVIAGDYPGHQISIPVGCAGLWVFTTAGSIPLGIRLVVSDWW